MVSFFSIYNQLSIRNEFNRLQDFGRKALCKLPPKWLRPCMGDNYLIKRNEGYRQCPYKDTKGHMTVCYGYNLDNPKAMQEVAKAGGSYKQLRSGKCTNKTVCDNLFNEYHQRSKASASKIFGRLSCPYAQAVAVDMTYNLGQKGMKRFHTFNKLLK